MTSYDEGEPGEERERQPELRDEPAPVDLARIAETLPGLARLAVSAWWNTTEWGVLTGWRLSRRFVAAARDPELARALARELGVAVGTVTDVAQRVADGIPLPTAIMQVTQTHVPQPERTETDLRRQGEALLARSRGVHDDGEDEVGHPAYARILTELAPDEARVLLLLYRKGPQPSVDVRTGGPVGMVSSRLVAPGLNMIAARAGLSRAEAVPSYLNNLFRLGLVWFSRESLRDPGQYQVLEAQPDVLRAVRSVSFAKVVRRSIQLTPFGRDFCRAALTDEDDGPPHDMPPEGEAALPPEDA